MLLEIFAQPCHFCNSCHSHFHVVLACVILFHGLLPALARLPPRKADLTLAVIEAGLIAGAAQPTPSFALLAEEVGGRLRVLDLLSVLGAVAFA